MMRFSQTSIQLDELHLKKLWSLTKLAKEKDRGAQQAEKAVRQSDQNGGANLVERTTRNEKCV